MHVNWRKVAGLSSASLKLAFLDAERNGEIMKGLKNGFPQCFTEEKQEPCVPVSVMRRASLTYAVEENGTLDEDLEWNQHFAWEYVLSNFNIPLVASFARHDMAGEHDLPVMKEVTQQLVGQRLKSPLRVAWEGVDCVVALLILDGGQMTAFDTVLEEIPDVIYLSLAPAKFFDFNA